MEFTSYILSYHAPPCFSKCLLFFLYSPSGLFFCFPFFIFSPLSFHFFKTEFEFTRAVPFKNFSWVLVFFLFIYLTKKQPTTENRLIKDRNGLSIKRHRISHLTQGCFFALNILQQIPFFYKTLYDNIFKVGETPINKNS